MKENASQKRDERLQKKMEQQEISKILDVNNFEKTYSEWNDKVLEIVEDCSSKKKKSKGWKVNRKLLNVKKMI